MMTKLVLLFVLIASVQVGALGSNLRVIGKVKSFNAKAVTVEVKGRLMEFDIRRVINKSKLHQGQLIEIDLDKAV